MKLKLITLTIVPALLATVSISAPAQGLGVGLGAGVRVDTGIARIDSGARVAAGFESRNDAAASANGSDSHAVIRSESRAAGRGLVEIVPKVPRSVSAGTAASAEAEANSGIRARHHAQTEAAIGSSASVSANSAVDAAARGEVRLNK